MSDSFQIPASNQALIEAAIRLGERLLVHPSTFEDQFPALERALKALRNLPARWEGRDWGIMMAIWVVDPITRTQIKREWVVAGINNEKAENDPVVTFFLTNEDPRFDQLLDPEMTFSVDFRLRQPPVVSKGEVSSWIQGVEAVHSYEALEVVIEADMYCEHPNPFWRLPSPQ